MKKLYYFVTMVFIFLMLNGCASIYVHQTSNPGVQPHVKKEMVKNEKRIREEQRKINKGHNENKRVIKNAQQQPWI